MGMDQARIGHALTIAAVANVPMRATRAGNLSLWKGSATAFAVRNAVYATQFAAGGMTGPEKPFEGRHGLMEQITGPFEIDAFPAAGGNWLLPWVRLKYWPVEYNAQAGVWAALKLREQVSIEARYLDPSMRPLMAKIAVSEDPGISALFPHKIVMRVAAVSTDGRRVEIETGDPRGDSTNPMGDREIDAKFSLLAEPVLGSAGSTRALEVWRDIDAASALSGPMAALVC